MEKLSLKKFKKLRDRTIEMFDDYDEYYIENFDGDLLKEYLKIIDTLCSHDLSEIDFEDWKGFYLIRNFSIR